MSWLHHILNHFPIALVHLAALALVVARFNANATLATASRWLVYATAASAIPVAATGLFSASHFVELGGDGARLGLHRNVALAGAALAVLSAGLVWAGAKEGRHWVATLGLATTIGATGLIATAGHFGGDMLHPGLAPWSKEPHHHGPAAPPETERGHAHPEHPEMAGAPGSAMVEREAPPAASTAAPSAAPDGSASPPSSGAPVPAVRPRPVRPVAPKPPVPKPAAPEDHSGHEH